jgi:hypothetical protein
LFVDLGVNELFPLVVPKHDFLVGLGNNVVGIERNFPTATRSIENVLGKGVSSGVTTQSFDEIEPGLFRSAKVGRALDEIALIEVVGLDVAHEKFVQESRVNGEAVINATQQHGLVTELDACLCESLEAIANLGRELARMVGVDRDKERMVLL